MTTLAPLSLTTDDLRHQRVPMGYVLQQRTPTFDWRSLRPFTIGNSEPQFLVHDDTEWRVYPASVLVPHVLTHEFDTGHPLPVATDLPDEVLMLPEDALTFLIQYVRGAPVDEAIRAANLTADAAPGIIATLADAGIHIVRTAQIKDLLASYEQTYRRSVDARADHQVERARTAGDGDTPPARPALGTIEPMTEEDIQRLRKRAGVLSGEGTGNRRWPFSQMAPGTRAEIPASMAVRAQRAAHVYGSRSGKKFKTARHPITGNLIVYRVDGVEGLGNIN